MDKNVRLPRIPAQIKSSNEEPGVKAGVIACKSSAYFNSALGALGAQPYVMTKGLMAPEAYVIEGILDAWINGKDAAHARRLAAQKYAQYQKIPLRNANWLFNAR